MKILKKPKIEPTTCSTCGCVFQAKYRNLIKGSFAFIKDCVTCPICNKTNIVKFKKENDNDENT